MIPDGFAWNQATLGKKHEFNDGLISIIAFDQDRIPTPIGTGFVLGVFDDGAVACSAAHNFAEVRNVQSPSRGRHHPTALSEFLPKAKPIDLDKKILRAVCMSGDSVEMATFGWAVWDESSDVAVFALKPQEGTTFRFEARFEMETTSPHIGDEVIVLGYKGMSIKNDLQLDSGYERFDFARELIMRCGRVTQTHPEGTRLCKGPCVETTIPVFPGMSGGPVFLAGNQEGPMKPFGVVSSDAHDDDAAKMDRSQPGSSIVSLVGAQVTYAEGGQFTTLLQLNNAMVANSEVET